MNRAAGDDVWQSGWRPACGWACAAGMAYAFVLRPTLPWIAAAFGVNLPAPPEIDVDALTALVTGTLGLGGLRTIERIKKPPPPRASGGGGGGDP